MKAPVVILLSFFVINSFTAFSFSDYPGFKPVANLETFKKEFAASSARLQTIESEFKQEKTLLALTETINSQGKIWFKRENKIRMDYTNPFAYSMIIRGDKMFIRDEQKESQVNVKSNKLFQQVNRIMMDCMQGAIPDSKDFSLRAFENNTSYLLEMTPVSKTLKEFFQTIVLIVEKKDSSPLSIQLNEPAGDKTLITLSNKTINAVLPDEVFSF
ncbi:MAG: outer membrane lipoprotein carrier protein LolA [Cyclobacteriaceae bacterium]|nr:outer membrane lipoprotein carrier protein LolA [Cyclobacteriaceae bacterium]